MEYCKYLQFKGVGIDVHLDCYKYQVDCPVREHFIGDIVIAMEKKDEIIPGDTPDFCPLKEVSNEHEVILDDDKVDTIIDLCDGFLLDESNLWLKEKYKKVNSLRELFYAIRNNEGAADGTP